MRLILLLLTLIALGAACSDDDDSQTTMSSATPTPTASASGDLKPPDSELPASGICAGPSAADPASVTFEAGLAAPRCLKVLPSTHLRFVNALDHAVQFELGSFSGTVQEGDEAVSELPVGQFLAPGVHTIMSTAYGDGMGMVGSGEVWLVNE